MRQSAGPRLVALAAAETSGSDQVRPDGGDATAMGVPVRLHLEVPSAESAER
jgi:hypothetical protein